ncbi:UNVERIFIED_CONTAM: hypothetical protein FKN15_004436 [Acipenser sinensis]
MAGHAVSTPTVLPAAPAPLLRAEPAGIHPLLVEVGGASSPPTIMKVEPAGINPLLVEVAEVEAMGLMLYTQREAVAVLAPSAVAAGLVRAVLPSAAKTVAAGEHQHPAFLPPKKFQGVEPVAPPLLALGAEAVEVEPAGILPLLAAWVLGLWKPRLPPLWAVDAPTPPSWAVDVRLRLLPLGLWTLRLLPLGLWTLRLLPLGLWTLRLLPLGLWTLRLLPLGLWTLLLLPLGYW